jgi:hypothetical protein
MRQRKGRRVTCARKARKLTCRVSRPRLGQAASAGNVHTARLFIGRNIGRKKMAVSNGVIERLTSLAAEMTSGGATLTNGRGRYKAPGHATIKEDSAIIDVLSSSGDACKRFSKRVRDVAKIAAKTAKQDTVLAVIDCAGLEPSAHMIDAKGKDAFPVPGLTSLRKKRRKVKK